MKFTEQDFINLEELALELNNIGISDEHYDETKRLLREREIKSEQVEDSITMTREKFYKPFDL